MWPPYFEPDDEADAGASMYFGNNNNNDNGSRNVEGEAVGGIDGSPAPAVPSSLSPVSYSPFSQLNAFGFSGALQRPPTPSSQPIFIDGSPLPRRVRANNECSVFRTPLRRPRTARTPSPRQLFGAIESNPFAYPPPAPPRQLPTRTPSPGQLYGAVESNPFAIPPPRPFPAQTPSPGPLYRAVESNPFAIPPPRPLPSRTPSPGPSHRAVESNPYATPVQGTPGGRRNVFGTSWSSTSGSSIAPTTPGSFSSISVEPLDRNTILAIVEGRGQARGEIGIACMNLHTPNLILCQFTDTQSYLKVLSKVNIFRPFEILMSATSCDAISPSQLCVQLQKEVPNVRIVPIQRRIFNEARGLQKLTSLVAEDFTPVVHSVTNKYYCLSACAALLKYVELVQSMIFSARSLRLVFQGSDQTCMIDHVTAQHLELLVNNRNPISGHCVFGIVNDCRTPLGARILRMNILQPPCDQNMINARLDSVEELMKDREVLYGLQDILGRLPIDIEHVIASLIQIPKIDHVRVTEQRINYIIALKHTLELIPSLYRLFENSSDAYFQTVRTNLMAPEFEGMLEQIKLVINEEAQFQKGSVNMKRQRCFAVKADVNPILDVARKAYCEIMEEINNYVIDLSQQMNMTLRLGTSNQRGFYIQYVATARSLNVSSLPPQLLQVRKRGNVVTFTTDILISSDHRAQEVLKEIENLSGTVIAELIVAIRGDIGTLFKVSEAIGHLDLIYSLANYALTSPRCVRPTFSKNVTSVTMGRHPILDSISVDPAVPNNVFLTDEVNFLVLTGPNMSGKTTYIKQVATLQVLAQIGSFVPAEAASFRICSNILSRIGTGDKIEENASSFAVELDEMNYILQNARDTSLIIIDELGRATSMEEGAAMSWAMAEKLLKTRAYTLFATHHMYLTKLESLYSNVMNYKMDTREWQKKEDGASASTNTVAASRLQYSHVLKRGVTDVENYGIKFAMSTSYPERVIRKAIPVVKAVLDERGTCQAASDVTEVQKERDYYLLGSHLCLLNNTLNLGETDPTELAQYFKELQAEFKQMTGKQDTNQQGGTSNDGGGEGGQEQLQDNVVIDEEENHGFEAELDQNGAENIDMEAGHHDRGNEAVYVEDVADDNSGIEVIRIESI